MSYQTVTDRIKSILETVEGVYNVHTYFRDIPDEQKFLEAFMVETPKGNVLSSWMMTRKSVATERPSMSANSILDVTHNIEIQGIYKLEDESQTEIYFQKIIDNILDRLKTKYTLEDSSGVSLAGITQVSEINISEIGYGQFSNYFVHFCRMNIAVEERI